MAIELLKDYLSDSLYTQVAEELKGKENELKLVNLADGRYVEKDKYDRAVEKSTALEAQNANTVKELAELQKSAGDNTELQKQLQEMQAKYDADTKAMNEKMLQREFEYSTDTAIKEHKAKNVKAVKALIDLDKIKGKDGAFSADLFKAEIDKVEADAPYLFESDTTATGTGGAPFAQPQGTGGQAFNFKFTPVNKTK